MKKICYTANIKVIMALLLPFCMLTVSCKKLIEIPASPKNQIAASDVFADSADALSAVVGIYNNISTANGINFLSGNIPQYTGLSADELNIANTNTVYVQIKNNVVLVDNSIVESFWNNAYSQLYQVNACLEGVTASTTLSASLKMQLTGEIKVVRALYYFNLINLYGPVPLVTSTDYKVTAQLPRASIDSIYALIIGDLSDARTLLNANYPSSGRARPNLYTASALLAKAYLYRGQWLNAENMAAEVINSGQYQLEQDLNNVFLDGSTEAIWQLPAVSTYSQTSIANTFKPYSSTRIPNYYLTTFLMAAFESGDQRTQKWIGTNMVSGVPYYYPYKYKNTGLTGTVEDYMMLRLGDQYLIHAEASAQQNNLTDAVNDLNIIRLRAGLSASTAVSQTEVLSAIAHERQTELFCEWGDRWFDLKRTGTIDAVLGAEKTGWSSYAALYPVPLAQLLLNPFLTQNPGYN